jgi:ABC-type phosphate transport system permease subunit
VGPRPSGLIESLYLICFAIVVVVVAIALLFFLLIRALNVLNHCELED